MGIILPSLMSHDSSAFHTAMARDPGALPEDPKDACLFSESMNPTLWLESVKELTR